jgi:HK97 family phage major capsid protein
MEKRKKLQAKAVEIRSKMQAMVNENDTFTDEQQTEFDTLKDNINAVDQGLKNLDAMELAEAKAELIASRELPSTGVPFKKEAAAAPAANNPIIIPANARRWAGNLHSFKGPDADVQAYKAGMFLAATICKSQKAAQFCKDNGIGISWENLHQEGVDTQGGYLVFPEFEANVIRLVEEYGLVRRSMRVSPMMSDVKNRPRRTGGLTAYFVGEGSTITQSTGSWDNVKLVAKKLAAITLITNEVASDAIISIADELVREIALAFATKEDECGFVGDGTSTYGGITGIVTRLSDLNGVDDGGGLVLASDNVFSGLTNGDFNKMIGRLPQYAGIRPEWYISKPAWAETMQRLNDAAGGNTMMDLAGPQPRSMYKGYPVNWTTGTTMLPVSDANSQIIALFGDMRMAADFGDRAGMSIAMSSEATVGSTSTFDTDSFAIRGVERFDINVHDVGTATAAGPVIGLISAAS